VTDKKKTIHLKASSEMHAHVFPSNLLRPQKGRVEKIRVHIDPKAKYKAINDAQFLHDLGEIMQQEEIAEVTVPIRIEEIPDEPPKAEPPPFANFIITAMMGSKVADAAIGDLTEVFYKNIGSGMSLKNAKAKYWGEVFFLAGPMLKELAKRFGLMVLAGKLLG
jgi:hypothetical protein